MEKKFKFSDKPLKTKIVYGVVIAILCITAIVIGIVSASSKPKDTPPADDTTPPISEGDGSTNTDGEGGGDTNNGENENEGGSGEDENKPKPLAFISPAVGSVVKNHSLEIPVFSDTLGEWRVHAGIDIATDENAPVCAAEDGVVSKIYSDPRFGYTIEVTHSDDIVTKYSNLSTTNTIPLSVGDEIKSGDRIGSVGDSSIAELAEEPHLHFEILLRGVKVNPLDYITKESKESSLGITAE